MKKVCILTSEESFLNNYGAALQGYALFNVLKDNGWDPFIVRYDGAMIPRRKDLPLKRRLYLKLADTYHFLLPTKQERLIRSTNRKFKKDIKSRELLFKEFQDINLKFNSDSRMNWFELKKNPPVADVYICGSDQIWNPYFHNDLNDLGYFLDFAPSNKPRIAYAPSFGCANLPDKSKSNIKELINKFQDVSVREEAGKNIILNEVGLDVPVVVDPTFLLTKDNWLKVAKLPEGTPKKYILCYRFSDDSCIDEVMQKLSKDYQMPIVDIPLSIASLNSKYNKTFQVGPAEFLGLIANASIVCTDSFHATVFSLIFNTPFYTFLRENFSANNSNNMNSRVYNLLELANLKSRLVQKSDEIKVNDIFSVDFNDFEKNIKIKRDFSYNWLMAALKKVNDNE